MAEGGSIKGKSLGELESEITCGICQEHYKEPKVLPCLHYYCRQCILLLSRRAGSGKPFPCPECRSEALLPEGGVDDFKSAFFVNRLRDKVSTIEQAHNVSIIADKSHSKVEVKCELCTESPSNAEAFCRQCARFVCKQCEKLHSQVQKYASHEIASLSDLKQGRSNPVPIKEMQINKCKDHGELLTNYCFTCSLFICHECTLLQNHKGHVFESCEKAASNTKMELLELVKPVKHLQVQLNNAVEQVCATKQRVESEKKSAVHKICMSIKELHLLLEKQEQELVNKIEVITQRKVFSLSMQEKSLSMASEEAQRVVDDTEQLVRHSTDNEVMKVHQEIRQKIEHTILEDKMSRKSMEPVEAADLLVTVKDAEWKELIRTGISVMEHDIDPSKCTVDMKKDIEVNKESASTLTIRLHNKEPAKQNCKVSCELKAHNGLATSCDIVKNGSGVYSIRYTPTVRGSHELTVQVDGKHIAGSPFRLLAFIPLSQLKLGKPLQVWKAVRPVCSAINSQGYLLVCQQNGMVAKISIRDQQQHELCRVNGRLERPCAMACDKNDNIYIIDGGSSKILTYNDTDKVKVQDVPLRAYPGRSAVCAVNEWIVIAETTQKNIIKIYNTKLMYRRAVQHPDIGYVKNIAVDNQGQMYVTNQLNNILVFTNVFVFVRSFTLDPLQKFSSLSLWNDHLLVTDYGPDCTVRVFSNTGSYITSFGRPGRKYGCFGAPIDICVDNHGFIYACDILNDNIQCF